MRSLKIVEDAVPLIRAVRMKGYILRIECPFCRTRRGRPIFHYHGDGGTPGPWHRLAHCADCDLPAHLRERARDLSYELVEASEPRLLHHQRHEKPLLRLIGSNNRTRC